MRISVGLQWMLFYAGINLAAVSMVADAAAILFGRGSLAHAYAALGAWAVGSAWLWRKATRIEETSGEE